jgi:LysR family glycine cleavage system transcriptional activator
MITRLSNLPLNGLRAFEAAARHLSFRDAADELAVTPAAISHQIKGLEERLDVALFERRTRAIALTDAGHLLLPEVSQGFQILQKALGRLTRLREDDTLTITASPSLAARWLLPRLVRLEERHPDLEIRISATNTVLDLDRGEADAALRFGRGNYPGLHVDCLATLDLFPVCAPDLATPERPLDKPADLAHHTLLHDDSWMMNQDKVPDWTMWLRTLGVDGVDATRGVRFDNAVLTLQAATLKRGVALASSDLAQPDLESGALIRPFDGNDAMAIDFGIYFVCTHDALERRTVADFRRWVLDEFGNRA